jgi:Cu(I)/Ag(I) efflux system protein CusF
VKATAYAIACALAVSAVGSASAAPAVKAAATSRVKHGRGTGVIRAIDARAGTLTIQHGAIPSVSWPAMTMTFRARPASLLRGLQVGQSINFDTTVHGMNADVTAVRPKAG